MYLPSLLFTGSLCKFMHDQEPNKPCRLISFFIKSFKIVCNILCKFISIFIKDYSILPCWWYIGGLLLSTCNQKPCWFQKTVRDEWWTYLAPASAGQQNGFLLISSNKLGNIQICDEYIQYNNTNLVHVHINNRGKISTRFIIAKEGSFKCPLIQQIDGLCHENCILVGNSNKYCHTPSLYNPRNR